MRSGPRKPRAKVAVVVALFPALLGAGLGVPTPAFGAPEWATPDPGSPAGHEYSIPFPDARGHDGGGPHHGGGGPPGFGGSGGSGGSGGAGGTGGTGTPPGAATLFGAGIHPAGHTGAGASSSKAGRHGARSVGATPTSADAGAVIRAAAHTSKADGQVALIVLLLLGSAVLLAFLLRFAGRRSPPAGAA